MKLIDLLVKELPKRGGWPLAVISLSQSPIDGEIYKYKDTGGLTARRSLYLPTSEDPLCRVYRSEYEAALAASQQPAWDGSGVPPIGTEFEYGSHRSVAKCIAVSYHHVFASKGNPDDEEGDYEEFLIDIGHSSFHPIRTEAERRREDLKSAIAELCRQSASNGHSADLIYDAIAAGKIPGVKLEASDE
jgi:hypothetical protein